VSLRTRLFILVIAAMLPAIAVQLYNELEHRRSEEAQLQSEAAQQAQLLAAELDRFVAGVEQMLVAVTHSSMLRQGQHADCDAYLASLRAGYNGPAAIGASDREGRVKCLSRRINSAQEDIADRFYFQEALRRNGLAVGEYAVGRAAGAKAIHIAYPLRDRHGQPDGVAFVPLNLGWLADQLSLRPLPRAATLTIADRNGTVLVRLPEKHLVGSRLPPQWQLALASQSPGATELPGLGGGERIVGHVAMSQGLTVAVGLSRDEAMAPLNRTMLRSLALSAASLLLGLGLAWLITERHVHRPMAVLTRSASRLRQGDLHARTTHEGELNSEFAALGRTFDQLAEALQLRESEHLRHAHALSLAKDEAVQASRSKTSFLAGASHDLRQPLHSMGLTVALLKARLRDTPNHEFVERLARSVSGLSHLVDALLDVSQLDAGLVTPQLSDFAVETVLQIARDEFAEPAQRKGVQLEIADTSARVRSDPILLRRIVQNLVANAVKFTPPGGSVRVDCVAQDDSVAIRVADTGPGIPVERQAEIWEEYHQLTDSQRDHAKGLGLGLAIVRRTAALLKHEVQLVSKPGEGAAFSVILPRGVGDGGGAVDSGAA
jgi:signal transduction histidine kinase